MRLIIREKKKNHFSNEKEDRSLKNTIFLQKAGEKKEQFLEITTRVCHLHNIKIYKIEKIHNTGFFYLLTLYIEQKE